MNIYGKLTILCIFLVSCTTATLYYFVDYEVEEALKKEIFASLSQQAAHSIYGIEQFIHQRLSDIRGLAQDPQLRSAPLAGEEVANRLRELHQLHPVYYSLSFFTMGRIRLADTKGLALGVKHSYSKYWKKLNSQSEVVMDISRSESVGKVVMHFAAVVRDQHNNPLGVVVSRILIDRLHDVLNDFPRHGRLDKKVSVDLIDQKGMLLYSNHNVNTLLESRYDDHHLLDELSQKPVNLYESKKKLYFYARESGYLNYAGNDWALITRMPKAAALSSLAQIRINLIFIVIPIFIASVCLALIAARFFVRPIVQLSRAAQEMTQGNLQIDFNIRSRDEIGRLAQHLRLTAQSLIGRIEEQTRLNYKLNHLNWEMSRKYQKIQEQKEEIAQQKEKISAQNQILSQAFDQIKLKNNQITSSINYAERIQRSMLPETSLLDQIAQEHFILYQPRDIVSGDFYWYDQVEREGKSYFILAAADCTGHGVPGSIMAMLGSNLLTNLVSYGEMLDPVEILKRLDQAIKRVLHQEDRIKNSQDGMEVALCVIDLETMHLEFAAGGRPLYLFRNGHLHEYKSDKIMLGGLGRFFHRENELPLKKYSLDLQAEDRIYLFSDGYQDQLGQHRYKKFLTKNFKAFLKRIHQRPMNLQAAALHEEHLLWKGYRPQTDDIMIMGIKF